MFQEHLNEKLTAYCHGELSTEESAQAATHLAQCERCRREYEEVRFGVALASTLRLQSAPASLWTEIESSLAGLAKGQPLLAQPRWFVFFPGWPRLAVVAGVLLLLLTVPAAWYLLTPREARRPFATLSEVDLGSYLRPVQAASLETSYAAIAGAPPDFVPRDREASFEAAGLPRGFGEVPPLPGYRLLAHRALTAGETRVVQLVYGDGRQAFSVFVAPHFVTFRFGREIAYDTEVEGIRCQKVDCPKQETYAFSEGDYRCVLVSKSFDPEQAVAVMKYFIAAHGKRG